MGQADRARLTNEIVNLRVNLGMRARRDAYKDMHPKHLETIKARFERINSEWERNPTAVKRIGPVAFAQKHDVLEKDIEDFFANVVNKS